MALTGFGATLHYDAAGGSSFTAVNNVTNISGINESEVELVETTHLGSTGKLKSYMPGAVEPGEIEFEMLYSETDYGVIRGLKGDESCTWKVTFPETSSPMTFTFTGILTKCETSIEMGDALRIKGTIKINSSVTIA